MAGVQAAAVAGLITLIRFILALIIAGGNRQPGGGSGGSAVWAELRRGLLPELLAAGL